MRVYILGDDIFSLFITNDDIHPRIGGSYGDWQDSGLFQKRTYGNSISPNIGFRASGIGVPSSQDRYVSSRTPSFDAKVLRSIQSKTLRR